MKPDRGLGCRHDGTEARDHRFCTSQDWLSRPGTAPAAIPKPVADRLGKELREIVALPDVNSKLLDLGFEDMRDVIDFPAFVDEEVKRWASVIREFNISI